MNRRRLVVVALVLAVGLAGCIGSNGTAGAPGTDTAADGPPDTATDAPTDTATDAPTDTATDAPTGTATDSPGGNDATGTTIDYEGDAVTLQSEAGQVVSGTTDRPPGTEITVRLTSQGSSPFLKQQVTSIGADGSFEASFDFSDIEPGTEFSVTVSHDGEEVASAPGEVAGS